jgi:hypothetical protein
MTVTTTGGGSAAVLAAFVALFVATALACYLALRLYRGYRANPNRELALLGAGLVSLATLPVVLRLVLSNVPVGPATRSVLVTVPQLFGLLLILVVVYGRR